jgi:adenine-specific DNA glycosylase
MVVSRKNGFEGDGGDDSEVQELLQAAAPTKVHGKAGLFDIGALVLEQTEGRHCVCPLRAQHQQAW